MSGKRYGMSIVVATILLVGGPGVQAAVRYVALDGTDVDGSTWTRAYTSIHNAIIASADGDEVHVKQGTYEISAAIQVDKAVKVYGGYSGSGETRDVEAYTTTVDGMDTARHGFNITADGALVDGFTITRGRALGSSPNDEGGGIYVGNCTATISNCILYRNHAGWRGGGICLYGAGATTVYDCQFIENTSSYIGGGLQTVNSLATISGCTFESNETGVAMGGTGGAIHNEQGAPTISDCYFADNFAEYGAAICNHFSNALIQGCTITNCASAVQGGGGIYNYGASPTISKCLIRGNLVEVKGGAVLDQSHSTFVNCIMMDNECWKGGGAIYIDFQDDELEPPSKADFVNCTIYGNHAFQGGGVYCYEAAPTFSNCIIWGNTVDDKAPGIRNITMIWVDKAIAAYCDIQGTSVYPGAGNILADPNFVDGAAGDFHLTYGSPCVDTGDNVAGGAEFDDYDGNPRIIDGDEDAFSRVDMGAFEYQGRTAAERIYWGGIYQGMLYDNPADSDPDSIFLIEFETDDSAVSIQFQTPAGGTYEIPAAPHTSSGEVETYHEVWDDRHVWEYYGEFDDPASLDDYGDGTYYVTVHYDDGSYHRTEVWYGIPGTSSPVVQPMEQPTITAPTHGGEAASPTTFKWQVPTEPIVDTIFLSAVDNSTGEQAVDDRFGASESFSAPYTLQESVYDVEFGFGNLYEVEDANGTPFEYGKVVVTCMQFEVPYATVYRFWAPAKGRHFYTISEAERDKLINEYGHVWTFEGPVYCACTIEYHPGLVPVYRFWSPVSGAHFYTITESEKDKLVNEYAHVWTYEGPVFYAYPEADRPDEAKPVYRFWKASDNTHFFTMKESEKDKLVNEYAHIYTYEGVAFYAYEHPDVP